MKKKILASLLVMSLAFCAACGSENVGSNNEQESSRSDKEEKKESSKDDDMTNDKSEDTAEETDNETTSDETIMEEPTAEEPTVAESSIGQIITFGNYEGSDITWIVLAEEEGKYLVISEYGLNINTYNDVKCDVTWETCSIRSWLNNEFLTSFNEEELARIQITNVIMDSNYEYADQEEYATNPGNDTEDRVFLLSLSEVETYMPTPEERICYPSQYAIDQGWESMLFETCFWWLRTPGVYQDSVVHISAIGNIIYEGEPANIVRDCVRPAMWIAKD